MSDKEEKVPKMSNTKEKNLPIVDYRLVQVTCTKCGTNWHPIVKNRPKKCPRCQSYKWYDYQPKKKKPKQVN